MKKNRAATLIATAGLVTALALAVWGCAPGGVNVGSWGGEPEPAPIETFEPATPTVPTPLIVMVGNSFIGGSPMDSGAEHRWPYLVADQLGADLETITSGGSGYVTPGDGDLTYGDLVREVPANADVVVVMGSDDDAGFSVKKIQKAALSALREVRVRAPHAVLVVTSTPWVESPPSAGITDTRDAVRGAAAEVGATFVDGLELKWLVSGPPGQIGSDGLHPTDLGHQQLAASLLPIIRRAVEAAMAQSAPSGTPSP